MRSWPTSPIPVRRPKRTLTIPGRSDMSAGPGGLQSSGPASHRNPSRSLQTQKGVRGMFHAIKTRIARPARAIAAFRLAQASEYATWHGWTVTQAGPGTWRYRDPRFDQLKAARTAQSQPPAAGRTWAQAALAERIHGLDLTAGDTGAAQRWS